jgi:hypothetical protein
LGPITKRRSNKGRNTTTRKPDALSGGSGERLFFVRPAWALTWGVAKRSTIVAMSWHHVPKNDAWKQAHLAMLVRLGKKRGRAAAGDVPRHGELMRCPICRLEFGVERQTSDGDVVQRYSFKDWAERCSYQRGDPCCAPI